MTFVQETYYMTTDELLTLDLWEDVAKTLNAIKQEPEGITVNDSRIWSGYLHRWHNSHWDRIIRLAIKLYQQHPEVFADYHIDALENLRITYVNNMDIPRCMDKKETKKIAWRWLMSMREIWNQCMAN